MSAVVDLSGVAVSEVAAGSPPVVLEAETAALALDAAAAVAWFVENRPRIDQLLVEHGALAFRGFAVHQSEQFEALLSSYPTHDLGYSGGATPRATVKGNVYEATQVTGLVQIPLHQEMAYLLRYPSKIAFWCNVAADTGGETTVGDVRRVMRALPTRLLDDLAERRVTYHRNFRPPDVPHGVDAYPAIYHATLQQAFSTTDRASIEQQVSVLGMDWEWHADGSLSTTLTKDAFATHPVTGRSVYFNHILTQIIDPVWMGPLYEHFLDLYDRAGKPRPYDVTFGDGRPVAEDDYQRVKAAFAAATVAPSWHHGDVLLIDNIHTAHGRNPYTGTRDVQVMLLS